MISLAPILRFVLSTRGWACPPTLEALAQRLPPVATAGLEMSLTAEGQVDLQQRIRGPAETRRLQQWLARLPEPYESWRRLRDALGVINHQVEELWLELDDGSDEPPLSVFARVGDAPDSAAVIRGLPDAFGIQLSAARRAALERCLAACESGAHPTHIGLMLGRPGAPIRIIIDGVPPDDIGAFLERSGWPGAVGPVQDWTSRLFVHADRIRLALTLADQFTPDIGLECFVGDPTATDPRWRCLFDMLVDAGLCAADQRDRLLAWPAVLSPASNDSWPDSLLVDGLLRGAQDIRWLECRMSHVKVTLPAGGEPSAKGYFGFLEVSDDAVAPPPRGVASRDLSEAVDDAVTFLLGACTQAGRWLDYDGFTEGAADEWVTAYVAHALHKSGRPRAAEAASRAWRSLARRERAGWGWNFLQPADADSTIWGLRLAADLEQLESAPARDALAFLRRHVHGDGGVPTYLPDIHNEWSGGAQINSGWFEAHACVTAAAAQLDSLGPAPLDYLRRTQQSDGTWGGYWWESKAYATALAAEALAATGYPEDATRVARAAEAAGLLIDRAANRDVLHERPFETALALRTALLVPGAPPAWLGKARDSLLAEQRADGSWTSSGAMSIPNRKGEFVPAIDNRRNLTTATVLTALVRLERGGD